MINSIEALLHIGAKTSHFPPTSRYHMIDTAEHVTADGRTIVHLRRRFIPQPGRFMLLQEHTVTQGDRLDNLTAKYIGEPQQFWRLCDANAAMHPDELTEIIGRELRITLPEGIQGGQYV